MKAVALAILLTCGQLHAEPTNVVVADLGLHVLGVGYQRTVAAGVAIQICAESYTPWTQEDRFFEVQGAVIRLRPVFYKDRAPQGWWLSPFGQVGIASATRGSGVVWAAGASAGYAWLVADHFDLAIGLGAQYAQARIAGGSSRPAFAEVWPQIDGSVGYAF
ncbi:MAG: DUF3575 domain-containing protein [Kofleriaceae bacterium]